MTPVTSSSIAAVGYDRGARTLYLIFRESGAIYAYFDVPSNAHAALMRADSKGTFVNTRIKPNYAYEKLD
jgi:hypothetical protein